MPENTTYFTTAIAATEKAIEANKKKLEAVKKDFELVSNYESFRAQISALAYESGQLQGKIEYGAKSERKEAEKSLAKVTREYNRLNKLDASKVIHREIELEQDITRLGNELTALRRLSQRDPRYILG